MSAVRNDTRMATEIAHYNQIENLQQINNMPIATIEERARPGESAQSGFLGRGQSFKDVLQKDWKTVEAMGTTHIELAKHLRALWNAVSNIPPNFANKPTEFSYDAKLLSTHFAYEDSASAQTAQKVCLLFASATPQVLEGRINATRGMQWGLFDSSEGWNEDLILKNPSNGVSLTVAEGVISYIEKYGFYEGGDRNPYRVDPLRLVALLTGKSPCYLRLSFAQPQIASRMHCKNEGLEGDAEVVDSQGRWRYELQGGASIIDATHGFANVQFIKRGQDGKSRYEVRVQNKQMNSPEYSHGLVFMGSKTITLDFVNDLVRITEFDDEERTSVFYAEKESLDDRVMCYEAPQPLQESEEKKDDSNLC